MTKVVPLTHYSFITLPQSTLEKFPLEIKNLIEDNNFYEKGIVLKIKSLTKGRMIKLTNFKIFQTK